MLFFNWVFEVNLNSHKIKFNKKLNKNLILLQIIKINLLINKFSLFFYF